MPYLTVWKALAERAERQANQEVNEDAHATMIYAQNCAIGYEEQIAAINAEERQAEQYERRLQEEAVAEAAGDERRLERLRTGVSAGLMGGPR